MAALDVFFFYNLLYYADFYLLSVGKKIVTVDQHLVVISYPIIIHVPMPLMCDFNGHLPLSGVHLLLIFLLQYRIVYDIYSYTGKTRKDCLNINSIEHN